MRSLPILVAVALPCLARAEPLLPAPSSSATDQKMADIATAYERQQESFAAAENGLSLDVFVHPQDMELVRSFFAGGMERDFQQVTGRHPFSVVETFHEHGDEGNFAGVATVGVAARLMVLRRDGASEVELSAARAAAVRAARTWHVYGAIAGNGIVARGVRRVRPENPNDPPLPGLLPTVMPLHDERGSPLGIVVASTSVYWTVMGQTVSTNGSIMRLRPK